MTSNDFMQIPMRRYRWIVPVFICLMTISYLLAQSSGDRPWNNKICAVALTYDDGLNVHLDKVIPALDAMGFKGTFYLTMLRDGVSKRIEDWRAAAKNGHELGNHTLFHPCVAVAKDRDYRGWVLPEYDLNNYTITRMVDEIRMANVFLKAVDGKEKRTIAYPCGDYEIKNVSYVPSIQHEFVGARGGSETSTLGKTDVFHIGSIGADDHYTGEQLIDLVKNATQSRSLLVFCFHGVGGEHNTNISLEKHSQLLGYLKKNRKNIWVAPLIEIAEYISKRQSTPKSNP